MWMDLASGDVADAVEAQLGPANLVLPTASASASEMIINRKFNTNESFWREIFNQRLQANTEVILENFYLFEWFPRSPGLYHTGEASAARDEARHFIMPLSAEQRRIYESTRPPDPVVYDIYGKVRMLRGGLGCIRLVPKVTEFGRLWFMSASSNLSAHEGVPVALSESHYSSYIDRIAEHGLLSCTLTGRLKFLPEPLLSLYQDYRGVRRLYLLVEDIQPVAVGIQGRSPIVSVAVSFESPRAESRYFESPPRACAAYISFVPGAHGSIDQRLSWLEYYVTEFYSGTIITDFDEQMTRFSGAVFSLDKVCNGRLRESEIRSFIERFIRVHSSLKERAGVKRGFGLRFRGCGGVCRAC